MSFLSDIKVFQAKALKAASTNTTNIAQEAFLATVNYSPSPSNPGPYAKGLLVNQYYIAIGNTPSSEVSTATSDTGEASKSRIKMLSASLPFFGKDNTVTLANNTEEAFYADKLGWAAGAGTNGWVWTGKAPYFMTAKAMSYIESKYK